MNRLARLLLVLAVPLLLAAGPYVVGSDLFLDAAIVGTAPSGTGITVDSKLAQRDAVAKVTITEAALTAAATTQDVTVWTVPAKTRVRRLVVQTTTGFTGGTIAAMTLSCGSTAGGVDYLLAGSVFSAGVLGDGFAEIGAGLLSATLADIPSMTSSTAISCRFVATGDNVVNATAGSLTLYLELSPYP
jgi:hypothetical protein